MVAALSSATMRAIYESRARTLFWGDARAYSLSAVFARWNRMWMEVVALKSWRRANANSGCRGLCVVLCAFRDGASSVAKQAVRSVSAKHWDHATRTERAEAATGLDRPLGDNHRRRAAGESTGAKPARHAVSAGGIFEDGR